MLAFVFAALVIGVLVVIGINKITENYVSDVYLEEDATIKRDKENIELFKEFISKNGVNRYRKNIRVYGRQNLSLYDYLQSE